jgi:hypothetical protein
MGYMQGYMEWGYLGKGIQGYLDHGYLDKGIKGLWNGGI